MRVGILTPTQASNVLAHGIQRSIETEEYEPGQTYDLVLIFNHVVNGKGYVYPEFPDPRIPIALLDVAEYGSTVTPRGFHTPHETKDPVQQARLARFLEGRSFPYFLREFTPEFEGRAGYHPIDYPLYHSSACGQRPDREEYLRRAVDVACIWGISHPGRIPITAEVRAHPGSSDVYVCEEDGPRIPQHEYFRRLRAARCSVSYDGFGSSSFRMTEILVRTALLLGSMRIRMRAPLVDEVSCFKYDGNLSQRIDDVLRNPEHAFNVYRAGYEHCMAHLTEHATTRHILDTIERHDWTVPTPL